MSHLIDLTNQRFGMLLVLAISDKRSHKSVMWLCRCDCGTEKLIASGALRTGKSRSCGCQIGQHFKALKGASHPNWKGGRSRGYKTGYYSKEYKMWRKSVFERDNFTCQSCGQRGGYLTAHHIKSFAQHPELRFELDNGKTLCEPCHAQTDNFKGRAHRCP